jgi:hypothetical protein
MDLLPGRVITYVFGEVSHSQYECVGYRVSLGISGVISGTMTEKPKVVIQTVLKKWSTRCKCVQ